MSWGDDDTSLSRKKPAAPSGAGFGAGDVSLKRKSGQQTKTSQMLGALKGISKPLNKGAEWLEAGAESIPFGVGDFLREADDRLSSATGLASSVKGAGENQGEYFERQRAKGVVPGKVGEVAGEIVGTLPLLAATRNPYLIGAGQGGLLSDADTPEGLLADVATGAALGKVGDVVVNKAVQVGSPLVRRGAEALVRRTPEGVKAAALRAVQPVSDALAPVRRALPPKKVTATGPKGQAERFVRGKAAGAGLRNAEDVNVRSAAEFADHPDVRGAELMGKEGEGMLESLTRQGGPSADMATGAMEGRLGGTPGRIMAEFERLGVNPETAAGDIEAVIRAGKDRSGAAFEEAFAKAGPGGIWNPELEALWHTPAVQKAVASVRETALNSRKPLDGLTMARVEVPGLPGGNPADAPPVGEVAAGRPLVRPGSDKPPSEGESFLRWFARQGGATDTGGDLAAMGAERVGARSRMSPQELDDLALRAQEAGFFPPGDRPTVDELLELVRANMGGKVTRARPDPEAVQAFAAREADKVAQGQYDQRYVEPLDELTGEVEAGREYADDFTPPPEGYGGGAAPEFEPALQEAPTARSWDAVRKRVNELIDWKPAKPEEFVRSQGERDVARDLRRALAGEEGAPGALPDPYRKGIEEGGDYIGIRSANRDFAGALFTNRRAFANSWLKLKGEGAKEGARSALATEIMDRITSGRLKPAQFKTQDVQDNIQLAFGDKAPAFLDAMRAEARLVASGRRFMPNSGSGTQKYKAIQEGMAAELEGDGGGKLADLGEEIVRSKSLVGGALGWAQKQILGLTAKAKNIGIPEETRTEMTRLLLLPKEEFAEFLAGPPQTDAQRLVQKYLLDRMDMAGRGVSKAAKAPVLLPPGRDRATREDAPVY